MNGSLQVFNDGPRWRWLGRLDYREALALMEAGRCAILDGHPEAAEIILCEHPPTITLGRNASTSDITLSASELAVRGVALERVSRGGQVTYHGPGQLMIYPVVTLRGSLVAFLTAIGSAIATFCASVGVHAAFRRNPAGVWVADRKIAACGIHLHRRVVNHGFAFNLTTPAQVWDWIIPCGMPSRPMVSLAELSDSPLVIEAIATRLGPLLSVAIMGQVG